MKKYGELILMQFVQQLKLCAADLVGVFEALFRKLADSDLSLMDIFAALGVDLGDVEAIERYWREHVGHVLR